MLFKNPKSKRENPFRKIYENPEFKGVLRYKNKPRDFPFLVDIEITNHCNLNCIFCDRQTMKRPKGFMEEKVFKKLVDECSKFGASIRFIRWGEPFLHPKIIDFSKYAKSKGLLVHITNNGLVIKENDMKALVEIGLDSLIFSFQGVTKQQYQLMRNNHRYDELKENIFKMVKLRGNKEKPFIHISCTVLDEPKEDIDKFVKYWGKIVDSVGVGKTDLSRLSLEQIKSFETIKKIEYLKERETLKKEYKPCLEVYQKLSLDWDGKVTCCCTDFDNFLTVGDLNNSSLFDIWNNSRELKIFRELLDKGRYKSLTLCKNCYHTYEEF